jgi:hypothetical protein
MDMSKVIQKSQILDNGVWVSDIPNLGDISLLVRPLASPRVMKEQARAVRSAPALPTKDGEVNLAPEVLVQGQIDQEETIDRKLLSEHILLGWKNMSNKGKPVKYSVALARKWIDEVDLFAIGVRYAAVRASYMVNEQIDKLSKN